MLTITFSNRIEQLQSVLLDRMAHPPASPFAEEQIIVPSAAMRRRLELAIADRFGVCSNIAFSFIGSWVSTRLGSAQKTDLLAPEVLPWRIFRIFGDEAFVMPFPRLANWLGKASDVMRYDLARQTAMLFGQYADYRPDWLQRWSDGETITLVNGTDVAQQDQTWQAALWRKILDETDGGWQIPQLQEPVISLSGTAHIFCPAVIAPTYIDLLHKFGQSMDLHLYLLNPCQEFWFDIVDSRRLGYLKTRHQADYHETGNRLLAAWGKQTQALLGLLFADPTLTSDERSCFVASGKRGENSSLLAQLQDAILDLQELEPRSIHLQEADQSIEVHVCHSLTRELEVLQDQLLTLFAKEPALQPADIVVVTPDLEQAAPLIDAIFGTVSAERRIPYAITGRPDNQENSMSSTLLALLSLATSRITASSVFNLLQRPVIARKFGLNAADLDAVHDWIAEAGIRWGLDANHRLQLALPESDQYSFHDGMHRLFLGYALPSDTKTPFNQRLPAGRLEGLNAQALGSFRQFIRQLTDLQHCLRSAQTPYQWMQSLLALADRFMLPENNELDDWREMTRIIRELCAQMQSADERQNVSADVLLNALTDSLAEAAWACVPTGMVTFTSIGGLRHLPYRIICAIGLNDGAFPSIRRPTEFDLMSFSPRTGDRQRRDDERNLFLDLLLAARERLYLSYTGRNVRDNSVMPPSVLIADLLDYLLPAIDAVDARRRLIVEHPLQPFSLACFEQNGDPRILSGNQEYFLALKCKLSLAKTAGMPTLEPSEMLDEDDTDDSDLKPSVFFRDPLPIPGDEWREVSLDQLWRFLRNPCRYLLRERLSVAFPDELEELLDDEPFLPDWNDKNTLADRLLPLYLDGSPQNVIRASALAGTEYPPGNLGQSLLERELQALQVFADEWRQMTSQPVLPPFSHTLEFSIDGQTWRLTGALNALRPDGLFRCRFDEVRPNDYLAGWIHHLFLNAAAPANAARKTVWHSRDGHYTLAPLSNAHQYLQQLLELYRQGLCQPLHFFPKSSWEYAKSDGNMRTAENKWRGKDDESGESRDPAYRQALRGVANPLNKTFATCSETVYRPLLQHIDDKRLKKKADHDTSD